MLVVYFCLPGMASGADSMRQWQLTKTGDGKGYVPVVNTVPVPVVAAKQVLVRMRAVSLNRKDIYFQDRSLQSGQATPGLSISDGAGEVVAVGANVTKFKVGDRVVGAFDTVWVDGASSAYKPREGLLSEFVVMTDDTTLPIPQYLSYEEAATLPCAAVTAWNTLFKAAHLQKDEYVLLEGTGGVSIFGLQFAAAAGARPVITSSSDEKLEHARKLGAYGTVNYRTHPDWDVNVREITHGVGVKHVLEVGGKETFPKAVASLAKGGHIGSIGGLGEEGFIREAPVEMLKPYEATWTYIYVGSKADFEHMLAFMTEHQIKPVIDRVFPFEQAMAAYDYMKNGSFFGKIVVTIGK